MSCANHKDFKIPDSKQFSTNSAAIWQFWKSCSVYVTYSVTYSIVTFFQCLWLSDWKQVCQSRATPAVSHHRNQSLYKYPALPLPHCHISACASGSQSWTFLATYCFALACYLWLVPWPFSPSPCISVYSDSSPWLLALSHWLPSMSLWSLLPLFHQPSHKPAVLVSTLHSTILTVFNKSSWNLQVVYLLVCVCIWVH